MYTTWCNGKVCFDEACHISFYFNRRRVKAVIITSPVFFFRQVWRLAEKKVVKKKQWGSLSRSECERLSYLDDSGTLGSNCVLIKPRTTPWIRAVFWRKRSWELEGWAKHLVTKSTLFHKTDDLFVIIARLKGTIQHWKINVKIQWLLNWNLIISALLT